MPPAVGTPSPIIARGSHRLQRGLINNRRPASEFRITAASLAGAVDGLVTAGCPPAARGRPKKMGSAENDEGRDSLYPWNPGLIL